MYLSCDFSLDNSLALSHFPVTGLAVFPRNLREKQNFQLLLNCPGNTKSNGITLAYKKSW